VVLEGVNGFLVVPNDAAQLAARMEEMMTLSNGERAEMGRKGRELVSGKFGIEKILQEYDATLSSIQRKA
jgi:glycosyltransferase involved in cell wall biosynthesis